MAFVETGSRRVPLEIRRVFLVAIVHRIKRENSSTDKKPDIGLKFVNWNIGLETSKSRAETNNNLKRNRRKDLN